VALQVYACVVIGHLSGVFLSVASELSLAKVAVPRVAVLPEELQRIYAPVASMLLKALLVGMSSSLLPVIVTFTVMLWTGTLSSTFGLTVGALSVMATTPMSVCFNAMQPVLQGCVAAVEMTHGAADVSARAAENVRLGDHMANAAKSFSAGSSSLVALSLFAAFSHIAEVSSLDLFQDPQVLPGLLVGSVMPFLFSALTMMTLDAVSKNLFFHVSSKESDAAMNILEVRRPGFVV
jgi:Na+/H+-translocating membrane pyrophosphatase